MRLDPAAQPGHLDVLNDVAQRLCCDLAVLRGEFAHPLRILHQTLRGALDALLQAIHQRTQGARLVDVGEEADEALVEIELEHRLCKIEPLAVADVAEALRPDHHAAHRLCPHDLGANLVRFGKLEQHLVNLPARRVGHGEHDLLQFGRAIGLRRFLQLGDTRSISKLREKVIERLALIPLGIWQHPDNSGPHTLHVRRVSTP